MTEKERIEAIRKNGGWHLKNFKQKNITYTMCLEAITKHGSALQLVPEQYRTKEIYAIACKTYGYILKDIPPDFLTHEICFDAVKSAGTALQYVPEKYLTEELCLAAVLKEPLAFQYVPKEILTPEFCIAIIKEKGPECIRSLPDFCKKTSFYFPIIEAIPDVFFNINKKYRTAAICKKAIEKLGYSTTASAVESNPYIFTLLHPSLYDHDTCYNFVQSEFFQTNISRILGTGINTPKKENLNISGNPINLKKLLRFYDVCLATVKTNGYFLKIVPQELMTEELCREAIIAHGYNFEFVPEEYKTKEICELAFKCEPYNLKKIPDEYKTNEMYLEAVKKSGYLLKEIPDNVKNREMCVFALNDKARGLDYIPEHLFDKEIAMLAIKNTPRGCGGELKKIPEKLRDYEVCKAAVVLNGNNLKYVPEDKKDYTMCLIAAQQTGRVAEYIPKEYFTPELCLALTKNGLTSCFDKIPKDHLTTESCLEAVKHGTYYGGTVIGQVPRHLITQEMCNIAIDISVHSLKGIPEEFVTEDILMHVAKLAPGRLPDNFPVRFRTKEFIEKMIKSFPNSEYYIKERILKS